MYLYIYICKVDFSLILFVSLSSSRLHIGLLARKLLLTCVRARRNYVRPHPCPHLGDEVRARVRARSPYIPTSIYKILKGAACTPALLLSLISRQCLWARSIRLERESWLCSCAHKNKDEEKEQKKKKRKEIPISIGYFDTNRPVKEKVETSFLQLSYAALSCLIQFDADYNQVHQIVIIIFHIKKKIVE